jgi:hypothetical protein
LRAELSSYKVPSIIWVCSKAELPFLDSGKIDVVTLAAMLAEHAPAEEDVAR